MNYDSETGHYDTETRKKHIHNFIEDLCDSILYFGENTKYEDAYTMLFEYFENNFDKYKNEVYYE